MDNEFRKRVALLMLPIVYREVGQECNIASTREKIAVEKTADIAELMDIALEKRQKK